MKLDLSLRELIDEGQLALVLGAGSSCDYGFPSWEKLKRNLITCAKTDAKELRIIPEISQFWVEKLESSEPKTTLDAIARDAPDECYLAFQKLVSFELLKSESFSKKANTKGWIELLFDFLFDYLKEPILINDLALYESRCTRVSEIVVVSLNYDRLFEFKSQELTFKLFGNNFLTRAQNRIGGWKKPKVGFFIAQPHGTIAHTSGPTKSGSVGTGGQLYQNNSLSMDLKIMNHSPYGETNFAVQYGDLNYYVQLTPKISGDGKFAPNLIAADDLQEPGAKLFTYNHANRLLQNKNVIVIGLSATGFNHSMIDLSSSRSIQLTNQPAEYYSFNKNRLPKTSVKELPTGLYASQLLKQITQP